MCASLVHVWYISNSKILYVRMKQHMILLSIHCIEGSYFGSLVNVMHIKCCYASMKSAMEVKICELYSPLIFEIGAKSVNPSVEME